MDDPHKDRSISSRLNVTIPMKGVVDYYLLTEESLSWQDLPEEEAEGEYEEDVSPLDV